MNPSHGVVQADGPAGFRSRHVGRRSKMFARHTCLASAHEIRVQIVCGSARAVAKFTPEERTPPSWRGRVRCSEALGTHPGSSDAVFSWDAAKRQERHREQTRTWAQSFS